MDATPPADAVTAPAPTPATPAVTDAKTEADSTPPDTVEYWRARSRQWERQAATNADAARELQELKDAQKSEAQRLSERLTAAETAAETARLDALRYRIGLKHGLSDVWIGRLQGSTAEELEADAAELAKSLPATAGAPTTKPLPALQLGSTSPQDETPVDGNEAIRRLLNRR